MPGQVLRERGIIAERLANGDVRYSVNVMVNGQRIHRSIGCASEGVTRTQCESFIEQMRTEARAERLSLPKGRKLHRTFGEAASEYMERMRATGGKDLTNKARHLKFYLVPYFGKTRLDRITNFEMKRYRARRVAAGAKDATVNREMSTLQHLLNRAASKDWGWIKRDDVPEIDKVKEARKQIRILSVDDQKRLLSSALSDPEPLTWLFAMFGLNAAMRHSEIVRVRYDEIDFDACRIWIDRAKAGERQQPITPTLRDALIRYRKTALDKSGWVFPAQRHAAKYPHRRDMRIQFARTVQRAGLDASKCTPHIMRHTAITALVKRKVDTMTIKQISGHKTTAMVEHYVHIFGEHVDRAIDALSIETPAPITPELHNAAEGPSASVERSKLETRNTNDLAMVDRAGFEPAYACTGRFTVCCL